MNNTASLAVMALVVAYSPLAAAQRISTLLLEGDPISGVGNVTDPVSVMVNERGDWLVKCLTDHANPFADMVGLRNGSLLHREGQALSAPAGSTLDLFGASTLMRNGGVVNVFHLSGTTGPSDDFGLYWNERLMVQEGDVSSAPGLSAGSTFRAFVMVRGNAMNTLLIQASIDDPGTSNPFDRVLMLATTDGLGRVTSETLVARDGDLAGASGLPIRNFGDFASEYGFNDVGQVMYAVEFNHPFEPAHTAIYLDQTLLAETGSPSPVPGRNWANISSSKVSLNNHGDWVMTGFLDGDPDSDEVMVTSSGLLVQEGESLPGMNGQSLPGFSNSSVEMDDHGNVLWYATWSDPVHISGAGLWINRELVAQKDRTSIGGSTIVGFQGSRESFHLDPSGRYVIFSATLDPGIHGVFLLEREGPGTVFCSGDGTTSPCPCGNSGAANAGCANSTGGSAKLFASGTSSATFEDMELIVESIGAIRPALLFSGAATQSVPFGDGKLCVASNLVRHDVEITDANGAASWGPGPLSNANWSLGDTRHFQVWYRDPGGPCSTGFNTSNGYSVTFTF